MGQTRDNAEFAGRTPANAGNLGESLVVQAGGQLGYSLVSGSGGGGGTGSLAYDEETVQISSSQTQVTFATVTTDEAEVFVEGIRLQDSEYSITNSSTITLGQVYPSGSDVTIVRFTGTAGGGGGGSTTFTGLTDTPSSFSGQKNKVAIVNNAENALEFVATSSFGGGGGSTTFTGLTDTPANYSGQAGKMVVVNSGETGLEFATGSLDIPIQQFSLQSDLQSTGADQTITGWGTPSNGYSPIKTYWSQTSGIFQTTNTGSYKIDWKVIAKENSGGNDQVSFGVATSTDGGTSWVTSSVGWTTIFINNEESVEGSFVVNVTDASQFRARLVNGVPNPLETDAGNVIRGDANQIETNIIFQKLDALTGAGVGSGGSTTSGSTVVTDFPLTKLTGDGTSQGLTANVTNIDFNNTIYDPNGYWSGSNAYVAPADGVVTLSGYVRFTAAYSGIVAVYKNGSSVSVAGTANGTSVTDCLLSNSFPVVQGDIITLRSITAVF
jgi:hypothetical protein